MRIVKPYKGLIGRCPDPAHSVLALVGDTQVGLWVVRSLARNGIAVHAVVRSEHGQSAHSRFAASAWVFDSGPSDPGFADEVRQLVEIVQAGSIMPVSEGHHNALIEARHRFEPSVHLFSPSRASFDLATDKDHMQALCEKLGVPVARGMRLDRLMASGPEHLLRFPLVLRTRRQNVPGGKAPWKAAYAETPDQLENLYKSLAAFADNILVQEYHPGAEDHVQILMHNGQRVMAGDYIGEHHMPLAGGVTVQRISCRHTALVRDATRLLRAIGYEGIAGVQFRYDVRTDRYIFIEINPRFSGGLPTVIMAGFEAPFMLWQSRFEPEKMRPVNYRAGLRTRILGGDANWLLGMLRRDPLPPGQTHQGKIRTAAEFLWNCGPWTRDDSFLPSDPKPFLVDFGQMVRKLGTRSVDIVGNQ
jgi:predicted ATP-grasp superfamily ATP-dependent carboligase